MLLTMLKAKIHRAVITETDLNYEGSISIACDILEQAGIYPHEQVDVYNINTGARFTTYAIEAPRDSHAIGLNGAAARLGEVGDRIIICAYGYVPTEEARNYAPNIVVLDQDNSVVR